MALDGLLTSLRSKARSAVLGFSLAAYAICGGSCGEAAKESDDSGRSCSYDRDCRRDEACIENSCKSVDVGQYSLDGIVTDWTTGNPVDGVKVTIKRDRNTIRDTTDARGHFQLSQLSEGTYTVTWEKGGYLTNKKSVQLFGADKTFEVELAPEDRRLNFDIKAFGKEYSEHTISERRIGRLNESSLYVTLGPSPEFINRHPEGRPSDTDGVALVFEGESTTLQVSQNHQVSYGPYEGEHPSNNRTYIDRITYYVSFAQATIPFEYYRFKRFGSGFLFHAKTFGLREQFSFDCNTADWDYKNESYRAEFRQYCEIEEESNERGELARCLSDDCHVTFKIDEIDIYIHSGIGDSY